MCAAVVSFPCAQNIAPLNSSFFSLSSIWLLPDVKHLCPPPYRARTSSSSAVPHQRALGLLQRASSLSRALLAAGHSVCCVRASQSVEACCAEEDIRRHLQFGSECPGSIRAWGSGKGRSYRSGVPVYAGQSHGASVHSGARCRDDSSSSSNRSSCWRNLSSGIHERRRHCCCFGRCFCRYGKHTLFAATTASTCTPNLAGIHAYHLCRRRHRRPLSRPRARSVSGHAEWGGDAYGQREN